MKKLMKKIIAVFMALMIVTACSGGKTSKADNTEGARALADEFFAGLKDQDTYIMTNTSKGEVYSVTTVEGDKMKVHYAEEGFEDVYLFIENGLKYIMYDGFEPTQDDSFYDMYMSVSDIGLKTFLDAILAEENSDLKVNATLTKGESEGQETKELVVTATGEDENGQSATITLTGKALGDKFMGYVMDQKSGEDTYNTEVTYEYGDDIRVEIPEHEVKVPREYSHIASPYATIGDVMNKVGEDNFNSFIMDGVVYTIVDTLQLGATMPEDVAAAFEELDVMDDDYQQRLNDLIRDLEIDDCVDFSEYVLTNDDFASYETVGDMINDGFEENGWSVYEGGSLVWVQKDGMVYEVNITLPEGFDTESDFDFTDLYGAAVRDAHFSELSMAEMPLG